MRRVVPALAVLLALAAGTTAHAGRAGYGPRPAYPWGARVRTARRFAQSRDDHAHFAVIDERGRMHAYGPDRVHHSASVVKVMFMVTWLRHLKHTHRHHLSRFDRRLLAPMITRSENGPASYIYTRLGPPPLYELAHQAGMSHFTTQPVWGLTTITPASQARFIFHIGRYLPNRFQRYALHLLNAIVPSQRWGAPQARPMHWRIFFKDGFVPGWRINQVALLKRRHRRLAVVVLTDGNPTLRYGAKTIEGVTRRLFRRYNRLTAAH